MTRVSNTRSSLTVILTVLLSAACVATPPSINTNERPTILDHPSVLAVLEHDPESSDQRFLDAVEAGEVYGFCLPVRNYIADERPVLCLITEFGTVYAIVDYSLVPKATVKYEIGPAIKKGAKKYYLPMLDAGISLEGE